jgi:hypothetical protein
MLFFRIMPWYIISTASKSVLDYSVQGIQLCHKISRTHGHQLIVASYQLHRNLLGSFLTEHLPTIIANIIGHVTCWFHLTNFDSAVGVNLTLLLVLTTM